MQVNIARMKPTASALKGIQRDLARIADCLEVFVDQAYGIRMKAQQPDTAGEEPQVFYTDEEEDFKREYLEKMGKAERPVEE
jgi:hypothetical protein